MSIGGAGNTVSFGIKAVADLRGISDTSKALADLSSKGAQAGQGIAGGMGQASAGLALTQQQAQLLIGNLDKISKIGFLAGGAIYAGLGVAVKQASDLNESLNKSNVVFGDQADQVKQFADTAARSLGVSKAAALESTATFGNLFKTMGLAPQASADMSIGLVKLASDLASFNNVDPSKVLIDLQAGLVGEVRPLRQYGIEVSDAAVKQELLKEGVRAVNGEFTEAQKVQARYALIFQQTTTAQGDFKRTSDDLANSLRIDKAEITDAAAALGTGLLPGVKVAAHVIGDLASDFAALPSSVQSGIAITAAAIGGLALVTAVVAKGASIVIGTAQAWIRLNEVFVGTGAAGADAAAGVALAGDAAAVATPEVAGLVVAEEGATVAAGEMGAVSAASAGGIGAAAASMGALALSLAPVAAGLVAIKLGFDDLNAIQTGGTVGIEGYAEKAGIGLSHGIAAVFDHVPWGQSIADSINKSADDRAIGDALQNVLKSAGFHLDTDYGLKGGLDVQIKELNETVGDFKKAQEASGLSVDDYIKKLQDEAKAAKTLADETAKAAANGKTLADQQAQDAADAQQAKVDAAIAAKKDQDALNKAVQDTLNAAFLADSQSKGLFLPFTRNATDAQKATEDFNKSLDDVVTGALNAERGIGDISSQLPGLQVGFGKVGDSLTDIIRKMDDVGVLDLSPSMRTALDAVSTLEKVQAKIDGVDKAIQNNQGDLAMWQGRIGLVTDTFGANSQQISEWQQELENGQITQEQFNAAIGTLAGSGGFPKLDALYQQGKISQEEYNRAKEAGTYLLQRSAGGIQDENAEIVDNIINLAAYVKAHDDADGAVNGLSESQRGFVAAMGDAKVQTFLQTLQLLTYLAVVGQIPKEAVTKFIADSSGSDPVIAAVIQDLGLIPKDKTTAITADASGYHETVTGINGEKIPGKVVTITAVQQSQVSTGFGGVAFPAATVADPPPVNLTANDQITPVVQAVSATLMQFSADAAAAGANAGTNFSDSLAAGLNGGVNAAIVAAGAAAAALDIGGSLGAIGNADGQNFGIGIANGIAATWNDVFNAAYYVAGAAHAGTQAGMDAHSPSKLALAAGINWGGSVAAGIRSTAADVHAAGRAIAALLPTAFADPSVTVAMRAALGGDSSQTRAILAASAGRGGGPVHHSQTIHQTLNFHGITDVKEIVSEVHTQTYRALDRGQAAGLFGS